MLGSNKLPPLGEESLVPNRLLFISRRQCPWGVSILQLQSGPDIYSWPQLLLSDWQLHQGPRLYTKPFQAAYMLWLPDTSNQELRSLSHKDIYIYKINKSKLFHPYLSQSFSLQWFMIPEAAVTSGPWHRSQWVTLRIGLPVWVVDASCTAKGAKAPLFRALHSTLADGHLVRAAGTGCSPWRSVSHSGWAVGVWSTPTTWDCGSIGP